MKSVIDRSLVADNLLFATHGDRCRYLGTPSREKARWLNENAGSVRRIDDIEQESVLPKLPVEDEYNVGIAPAEPHWEISPNVDVVLINTPPGDWSPYQPTSLPAQVRANGPDGSTPTEQAPPHARVPTSETSGPVTEAALLGEMARNDGRQRKKQSQPGQISKADRKLSPKRMRLVLNSLRQYPYLWHAAGKAGIHRRTLEYWMKRSKAGDDGYDVKWQGLTWRFHEHCISAIEEAHDRLLSAVWQLAMGVTFTTDADGNFIEETVGPPNPKMLRLLLEWLRPDTWGKNPRIDVPREGGVLVLGGSAKPENDTAASVKARRWKSISRKIRKTNG